MADPVGICVSIAEGGRRIAWSSPGEIETELSDGVHLVRSGRGTWESMTTLQTAAIHASDEGAGAVPGRSEGILHVSCFDGRN